MHSRMFCSIPGLYPLDTRNPPFHLLQPKTSPEIAKCPPAGGAGGGRAKLPQIETEMRVQESNFW